MFKRCCVLFGLFFFLAGPLRADPEVHQVRSKLLQLEPDLIIEQIYEVALPGWYQVRLRGGEILYTDAAVNFVFYGELYQIDADNQATNLTQVARAEVIADKVGAVPEQDMIIFAARQPQAQITVFTDVDCTYCQKLHSEVEQLNAQGVSVRYLAYPNGGVGSPTYDTMVGVWCADDRQQAMNAAKQGQPVAAASCKNPVEKQYALGRSAGVQGTPNIILENGELVPGYVPAQQLAAQAIAAARQLRNK